MNNLNNTRETKLELVWIELMKLIGLVMFISPLYLPVRAYFFESKQSVPLSITDISIAIVGFFLWRGGKHVGTVVNNIGVIIINVIKKIAGNNNAN